MSNYKILTISEYLKIYSKLNNMDSMVHYLSTGALLMYCDNVLIETRARFEELKQHEKIKSNRTIKHNYNFIFLPVDKFRIVESNEAYTLIKKEELKSFIKT